MIKNFLRWVFGGGSGKREAAWIPFILWCMGFVFLLRAEMQGLEVGGSQSILELALIPVLALVAAAHGLEHLSSRGFLGGVSDK